MTIPKRDALVEETGQLRFSRGVSALGFDTSATPPAHDESIGARSVSPAEEKAREAFATYLREKVGVVIGEVVGPPGPHTSAEMLPSLLVLRSPDGRNAFDDELVYQLALFRDSPGCATDSSEGGVSLEDFIVWAPAAMLDVAAELVEREAMRPQGGNTLAAVGALASAAVRRTLLREVLVRNNWNMTVTGTELKLGGTGNVLRAIKDLGLEAELEEARRDGSVKRGGHRKSGKTR